MNTQFQCRECGETQFKKSGFTEAGTQRYECTNCKTKTTNPKQIKETEVEEIDSELNTELHLERLIKELGKKRSRIVITSAQNATPVHSGFFNTLKKYCELNNALLVVIPYRYHNPTSIWSKGDEAQDWWADELVPYLLDQKVVLNDNIVLLADIKTQPTAVSPTSGFETITSGRSAILGHPKLEWVTIPTPNKKLAKVVCTTGAVTKANYTPTKAGKKGEHHHTFGAALVEIEDDKFFLRQLVAVSDGRFIDLDYEYSPKGRKKTEALGLVMGDTHYEFIDPGVVEATFTSQDSMVAVLKPKYLIWHDLHDFYSRTHHHIGKVFINYAKYKDNRDDIELWLTKTFEFVDRMSPNWTTNIIVPSNHPEALARWVAETDPKQDPKNLMFWAETFKAMLESTKSTPSGTYTLDPFAYWGKKKLRCSNRTRFLQRDESFRLRGVEVGYHGDVGAGGARGSIRTFGKIGTKTIIGHSHTPGIKDGVWQVGTSSRLKLDYNTGPSSWLHCHGVIYANGKRSLLVIVDGQWRIK